MKMKNQKLVSGTRLMNGQKGPSSTDIAAMQKKAERFTTSQACLQMKKEAKRGPGGWVI